MDNKIQGKVLYMLMNHFSLRGDSSENRQYLQKTVYLLVATGVKIGYGFSWWKYGPCSSTLIEDAHIVELNRDEFEEMSKDSYFSECSISHFDEFEEIVGDTLHDLDHLELFASTLFLINVWDYNTQKKILEGFKKHKRVLFSGNKFTQEQILSSFRKCKKLKAMVKEWEEESAAKQKEQERIDKIKNRMYNI